MGLKLMSLYDEISKYKIDKCYGPFCSIYSCGKFEQCSNDKCYNCYWYPDQLKEKVFSHSEKKDVKTCDLLECTSKGIYIAELKPKTRDMFGKINGTYKTLKKIYPSFGVDELKRTKAFLIRCVINKKFEPNYAFRDALNRLSQNNEGKSLYDNNECIIDGVSIKIEYHRPCSKFIKEDINKLFV